MTSTRKSSRNATPKDASPLSALTNMADGELEFLDAQIAEAAYFLAEQRGFAPGCEMQDWLTAEAEVRTQLKRS